MLLDCVSLSEQRIRIQVEGRGDGHCSSCSATLLHCLLNIVPFKRSGNYMQHLLQQSVILHTACIYGFHIILRINNDYFLKQL
jgi:hypothetical protein